MFAILHEKKKLSSNLEAVYAVAAYVVVEHALVAALQAVAIHILVVVLDVVVGHQVYDAYVVVLGVGMASVDGDCGLYGVVAHPFQV